MLYIQKFIEYIKKGQILEAINFGSKYSELFNDKFYSYN
jgi:hypothetical protein